MNKSIKFLLFAVILVPTALFVTDQLVRYGVISTQTRSIVWLVISSPLWLPMLCGGLRGAVSGGGVQDDDNEPLHVHVDHPHHLS